MKKNKKLNKVLKKVLEEYQRASDKHRPFHSHHEGYCILAEEVSELWDTVKHNQHKHGKLEAIQVAAMAIRYLVELY